METIQQKPTSENVYASNIRNDFNYNKILYHSWSCFIYGNQEYYKWKGSNKNKQGN